MLRALCLSLSMVLGGSAAGAQVLMDLGPRAQAMLDAVGIEDSLDIMIEAGRRDARLLEEELFPEQGGTAWGRVVDRLYTRDTLAAAFVEGFPEHRLSDENAEAIAAFFTSDLGRRIVEAELTAWRAITDPEVEAAANEVYFQRLEANDPRLAALDRFTEANSFVDLNVMGSLNANLSFLRGLSDGGAYEREIPEDLLLAQIWEQEPELRENTILWLYSFHLMAYSGLSDADMAAYIAFSETEAGRTYNSVLFEGYDAVFTQMSYRLGQAAALFMTGEPL